MNAKLLRLVKYAEAGEGIEKYLDAYKCPAGVWTIGYGHTGIKHSDGTVYEGRVIDKKTAHYLLLQDLQVFANKLHKEFRKLSCFSILTDDQMSAIISLAFNVGRSNVLNSKGWAYLQDENFEMAWHEWADPVIGFVKAGGKPFNGLIKRRQAEKALFFNNPKDMPQDYREAVYG